MWLRVRLCLGLLALATACGASVTISRDTLTFTAEEGQPVEMQAIWGSLLTLDDEGVFITFEHTHKGIAQVIFRRTSGSTGTLEVYPRDSRQLAPGQYQDTVTLNVCKDAACTQHARGSPAQADVTYTVKPRKLPPGVRLSERSVALTRVPTGSRLTRTLEVQGSASEPAGWRATADQPWLTVTPSGIAGGALTVSANPEGLADGFHEGRVTVASDSPSHPPAGILRVGLYVSSTPAATAFTSPIDEWTWVVDPLRPYVYSNADGAVFVNHVYTGARVSTIPVPGGTWLGDMAVSDDGSRLYALDTRSGAIAVIDLDRQVFLTSWPLPASREGRRTVRAHLAYARVAGISPVLLVSSVTEEFGPRSFDEGNSILDAETGQLVGRFLDPHLLFGFSDLRLVVSGDGNSVYTLPTDMRGPTLARYELRTNSRGDVWGISTHEPFSQAYGSDIAVSRDGASVFLPADAYPQPRTAELRLEEQTFREASSIAGPDTPASSGWRTTDVELDSYGRLLIRTQSAQDPRFRLYGLDRSLLKEWDSPEGPSGDGRVGTLRVSSDGLRALGSGLMMDLAP
jgi:DNA-binding beta-propeller fold protein YncE